MTVPPHSSALQTLTVVFISSVNTQPQRPNFEAFAISIASSVVSNSMIGTTGPKISISIATSAVFGTPVMTVGVINAPSLSPPSAKGGHAEKFRTVIFLYLLSILTAAVAAVFINFIFRITVPLTDSGAAAKDLTPPGSVSEILGNLFTSVVSNPLESLSNGNYIAMQMVGIGFIISVIQDSMETALNSSGDAIFTATAEFRSWIKEGRELPL